MQPFQILNIHAKKEYEKYHLDICTHSLDTKLLQKRQKYKSHATSGG
jgi:hypothetical protein